MKKFSILLLIAIVFGGWFIWQWGFCRFYVAPDFMAVLTAKTGTPLEPGQILAKPGQQGVQEEVLGEGRHFRNPWLYDWEIRPVINIPAGKIGIVTAKVGQDLPAGEFLAQPGQKGIWKHVLGPGKYRLNPYGYQIDITDATSIPIGYVGVLTSLSGAQAPAGEFAEGNQKGVRKDTLQPGLYYLNPKELKCNVLEIGVSQVSLLVEKGGEVRTKANILSQNAALDQLNRQSLAEQKQERLDYIGGPSSQGGSPRTRLFSKASYEASMANSPADVSDKASLFQAPDAPLLSFNQQVSFPSRDGFEISLDMTVEFELLPSNIAWVFRSYGDLPAVVENILMPQILSISRLKGSAYGAKDFIVGEGREKFQNDLTGSLARALDDKKIIVHNALIRHVNVPMQILDPIQQASVAVQQDLTNKEKQNTAKKQAQLNTELSLIEQRGQQVAQETEKLRAEIKADQEKQVAEIRAATIQKAADIERETARIRADKTRKLGEAQANVITLVEGEKAKGFELKAKAFGDPAAYSMWEFANNLNRDVKITILHSGPGTLWTDLEKASLGQLGGAAIIKSK